MPIKTSATPSTIYIVHTDVTEHVSSPMAYSSHQKYVSCRKRMFACNSLSIEWLKNDFMNGMLDDQRLTLKRQNTSQYVNQSVSSSLSFDSIA